MTREHCDLCDVTLEQCASGGRTVAFLDVSIERAFSFAFCNNCIIGEPAKVLSVLLAAMPSEIKPSPKIATDWRRP